MRLTPLDIRHKEFKRGMRGYAEAEVDEFLDLVADEYERLFKESTDLKDRAGSIEERDIGYKRNEELLQRALVSAQINAEETKQKAQEEAERVLEEAERASRKTIEEAERRSRQILEDAELERQGVQRTIEGLRAAELEFRTRLRGMVEDHLRLLDSATIPAPSVATAPVASVTTAASPESDDVSEFVRQAQAIKAALAREQGGEETSPDVSAADRRSVPSGEDETLLADVDPEVSANEFKW